jgi:hypothetical protein
MELFVGSRKDAGGEGRTRLPKQIGWEHTSGSFEVESQNPNGNPETHQSTSTLCVTQRIRYRKTSIETEAPD